MTDPLESLRQDVMEKAAKKRDRIESHGSQAMAVRVVFPCEGHLRILEGKEPLI
jgi:hypothetical protein